MNQRRAAFAAAMLLVGCSGGGSAIPHGPAGAASQSVTVRLAIPVTSTASAERAHPQFVVSATNGMRIVAHNAGGSQIADQSYDVSSSSPLCTTSGGLRSCALAFTLPPGGPYTLVLTSYDEAPSGGTIPVGAHELAQGAIPNVTIAQGESNALSATLDGTPATLTFATARNVALQDGAAATVALPLGVTDASGTSIVGAFSAPLTANVSESGGHTLLSIDGGTTKTTTLQLQSSTDAASLAAYYDGGGSTGYVATISSSGSGAAGGSTTLDTFSVSGTPVFGTPTFANHTVAFSAPSQQIALIPIETGYSGSFSQTNTCAGFANVTSSGGAFAAQSILPTASCSVSIFDGTRTFVVPVSVTTTSGSVGVPPATGSVTIFATLSSGTYPWEIVNGPDGALWFVAYGASDPEFGRLTTTGVLTVYAIPNSGALPQAIAVGPDGRIWSGDASGGSMYAIDPTTHAVSTYDLSGGGVYGVDGIAAGPDGNLWVTDGTGAIDRISTSGALLSQTPVAFGSAPFGIVEGPDGAMWFGDAGNGVIGRIDPVTLALQAFPTTGVPVTGVGRLTVGADGALWAAMAVGGVGRMTTAGAFTFYPSSPTAPAFGIAAAPDNALWYPGCGCSGNSIGRITTGGAESVYDVGTAEPYDITVGSDGGLWFTDDTGQIGRIQP